MASKGYRYAVRWIALNDEPGEMDAEVLEGLVSVALVADLHGKDAMAAALAYVARITPPAGEGA